MFSESMWDVMCSWLTPTMLFLLLNFMIATIFVTSGFGSQKPSPQPEQLQRSPSVLQRLKSVNFYQYGSFCRSHEIAAPVAADDDGAQMMMPEKEAEPVVYEAEDRFEEEEDDEAGGERSLDEVYSQLQRVSHHRTRSDMEPSSGAVAVKLVKKMKKSASSKSAFKHFKEAEILEARRPATVKESKTAAEDEEVDSKADDFINKFKQQLKLQRLDSILRYKEMLGRGAAK